MSFEQEAALHRRALRERYERVLQDQQRAAPPPKEVA